MEISPSTRGIHHITAIASDPQRNLDFYTRVLGLRLVKKTVNFDDPGTYHFYFADSVGNPGTVLTFFPWPNARKGQPGNGQVGRVSFSAPASSLPYWKHRLVEAGVETKERESPFGERTIIFQDPDGTNLEVVVSEEESSPLAWGGSPVPQECAIHGFHRADLWLPEDAGTINLLAYMGFEELHRKEGVMRLRAGGERPGNLIDVHVDPSPPVGRMGAGAVHHIAFRASDNGEQDAWRERLLAQGFQVTPPKDRRYFRSIYFREPGGILFEIATDGPGFTTDESVEELGSGLKLPPWFEEERGSIEAMLPPLL